MEKQKNTHKLKAQGCEKFLREKCLELQELWFSERPEIVLLGNL